MPAVSEAVFVLDAAAILSPFERFSPGRVVVRGDRIEAVGGMSDVRVPEGATRVDAMSLTLVPGFIEPHVHGCGGFDVMEATPESMAVICTTLARHGTTSFLPTTVSSPVDEIESALDRLGALIRTPFFGARPLGIHLEGPFLNAQRRGTHQQSYVRLPDAGLLSALLWPALAGSAFLLAWLGGGIVGVLGSRRP